MGEGAPVRAFAYHRSHAPMLYVFLGLATIELAVTHMMVALLWSHRAALVLSLVSLAGIGWIVAIIRSFRRLPVTIAGERVTMRLGRANGVVVERSAIAGLRDDFTAETLKDRAVLDLSMMAWPNLMVELREPVPARRGRMVRAVAMKLDDPAAFAAALAPAAAHA